MLARRQGLKPANRALEECSRGVIVAVRAELQCDRVHDGAGSLVRCLERARLLDNGVELSDATQRRQGFPHVPQRTGPVRIQPPGPLGRLQLTRMVADSMIGVGQEAPVG